MEIKKFIEENELLGFPIGLGGCRSLIYFLIHVIMIFLFLMENQDLEK